MYIKKLKTKPGRFTYSSSQILEILCKHFATPSVTDFLEARISNSGIAQRSFCYPLETIINLEGLGHRSNLFHSASKELIQGLFDKQSDFDQAESLITTSCSVPALPARDLEILNTIDFKKSPFRIPTYQQGCLGGVWSLALANNLKSSSALVCSYELCSLLFQNRNLSATQLMGAVLFADGIGAAYLDNDPKDALLKIIGSEDLIIAQSDSLLGYNIQDEVTELVLSPQIPGLIENNIEKFVSGFLAKHNLGLSDISTILSHPGGVRILEAIQLGLKIEDSYLQHSYKVLNKYGNLSSASIFFVIEDYINSKNYKSGDYTLIVGIGPGINLELILCQIP